MQQKWDIFCKIVDNYGDIGVCWRLARQLNDEHYLQIRLWVDDFSVAKKIIQDLNLAKSSQICNGVTIIKWDKNADFECAATVVIETFSCGLPPAYLAAMASEKSKWINLEYLSAEAWVDDFHAQSSPQSSINTKTSLTRHFYFPGFTTKTGGLIRESQITSQLPNSLNPCQPAGEGVRAHSRGAIYSDSDTAPLSNITPASWRDSLINGQDSFTNPTLKISLFCYPNAPINHLFDALQANNHAVLVYVPQSSILPNIATFFGKKSITIGDIFTKNSLTVAILPFLNQANYDELLSDCDLNFVRGEDSWIRAIWAGKPFIWQPYFQDENTHITKLNAFINLFYANYEHRQVVCEAHRVWVAGQGSQDECKAMMLNYSTQLDALKTYTLMQAIQLS